MSVGYVEQIIGFFSEDTAPSSHCSTKKYYSSNGMVTDFRYVRAFFFYY